MVYLFRSRSSFTEIVNQPLEVRSFAETCHLALAKLMSQNMKEAVGDSHALSVIVSKEQGKATREQLEKRGLYDDTHKMVLLETGQAAVPSRTDTDSIEAVNQLWSGCVMTRMRMPASKKTRVRNNKPAAKLVSELTKLMQKFHISDELKQEIPRKWEKYEDLVIVPASAFVSEDWKKISCLWEVVAQCLSCQRLARHAPVANDSVRSSQVSLLFGDSGQVTHIDNSIRYSYDVTKCMYSSGNITEKLRIAGWDCSNETVVDLYSGIGYFTLPYLVHAKAKHVHACEWNPNAVTALRKNLRDNGVSDRCTVHEGDCRLLDLPPVADRINLGLIPSSQDGWPTAVRVLNSNGGMLHIHSNVEENYSVHSNVEFSETKGLSFMREESKSNEAQNIVKCSAKQRLRQACAEWSSDTQSRILSLLQSIKGNKLWSVEEVHLELVKSYAPHIVHVVLDLLCKPLD